MPGASVRFADPGVRSLADRPLDPPWQALREAYLLLKERWALELSKHDLSFADFVVLHLCERSPPKASDIAREVGITAAGATDLIDRLTERGLVRRAADLRDRRIVRIRLNAAGKRLIRETAATRRATMRRLSATMTGAERAALERGLGAMVRALRAIPAARPEA